MPGGKTSKPAPQKAKVGVPSLVTRHLLADRQPKAFVDLADLQVKIGDEVFPCHSPFLAKHSKVLAEMEKATDRGGWAAGVSTLFQGHRRDNCLLLLTMIRSSQTSVRSMRGVLKMKAVEDDWEALEDVLTLVCKLDAPQLMQAFDEYAENYGEVLWTTSQRAFQTATFACSLGLTRLQEEALDETLWYILDDYDPVQTMTQLNVQCDATSFAVYRRLAAAVAGALLDGEKDLKAASAQMRDFEYSKSFIYKPEDAQYRRSLLSRTHGA